MRILAPTKGLIDKLVANKFAKVNNRKQIIPTAKRDITLMSHYEILKFYNARIRGILNFYSFAGNLNALRSIISILQRSCALTLALKYKLRTQRAIFLKYGRLLTDPDTKLSLEKPKTLKVSHDYKTGKTNNLQNPDNTLSTS